MDREPRDNAEIDQLFAQALELEGSERAAFVAGLRSRDPSLAQAVERLLTAVEQPDSRREPGGILVGSLWKDLIAPEASARTGERVGAYRILEEIGRGGMSVVYLAERTDGLFEQRVALKFLAQGPTTEETRRRFGQERQILASLTHRGIARLLGGGHDSGGRPYIVMEHVEGEPIDRYCDRRGIGLEERLELFGGVLAAVEYAHRNLVVHRDLKPSNILVTGDGEVKLLDFGIAKLLDPERAGPYTAPPTRTGMQLLTPEYSSPEQIRGERITTASDIYQLGLLLYELLTGRRPFSLAGATASEAERIVCEQEPSRPSTVPPRAKVSPMETGRPVFGHRLKGDLDNIVLKSLEKEPERRYATAGEFREDLERQRTGLPVRARKPTLVYRAAKFARRHRGAVAAGLVVVALLVGYAATVTVQAQRIAQEAAKTEQVKDFLTTLFTHANPGVSKGQEPTASELLEAGAARVATELADQPDVQAEMMAVLGRVYGTRGQYAEAVEQLEKAWEIQRRLPSDANGGVTETGRLLAEALHFQGRYRDAEAVLSEVIAARRQLFGDQSSEVGIALNDLGDLLHTQGRLREAEDVLREGLAIQLAATSEDSHATARARRDLANVLRDRGAFTEAERLYHRSLATSLARLGRVDPIVSLTENYLARLLAETGRHSEAEAILQENLSVYAQLYPDGHPMVGTTLRNLGVLRLREGRPEAAEEALREALAVYRRTLSEDNALVARAQRYLAEARLAQGDAESAAAVAEGVLARLQELGMEGHPAVADACEILGRARLAQGRPAEAVRWLKQSLAVREASSVPSDPRIAEMRGHLARAQERLPSETPTGSGN